MKYYQRSGDKLILDVAHKALVNNNINWREIFGTKEELATLLSGFDIEEDDLPNIFEHFNDTPGTDYDLTDVEARFICRNFVGDPVIEAVIDPFKTGDEAKDDIFFKIFSDFIECNNHLKSTIDEWIETHPWGVWQTESIFYKTAPNAILKAVGKTRKEYIKDVVLNAYGKPCGRRKFIYVEKPKPVSFF